jgi:hypothetical protein
MAQLQLCVNFATAMHVSARISSFLNLFKFRSFYTNISARALIYEYPVSRGNPSNTAAELSVQANCMNTDLTILGIDYATIDRTWVIIHLDSKQTQGS